MTQETIYKISSRQSWLEAHARGAFLGSADDVRDGYIHMSAAAQVAGTLAHHFADQKNLIVAAVDPALLGDTLRWESSRDGTLYPHIYGPLPMAAVTAEFGVALDANGRTSCQ
jgi:uncharacterized protein (DUF952 family)